MSCNEYVSGFKPLVYSYQSISFGSPKAYEYSAHWETDFDKLIITKNSHVRYLFCPQNLLPIVSIAKGERGGNY